MPILPVPSLLGVILTTLKFYTRSIFWQGYY